MRIGLKETTAAPGRGGNRRLFAGSVLGLLALVVAFVAGGGFRDQSKRETGLAWAKSGRSAEAEPLLDSAYERNRQDLEVVSALAHVKLKGPDPASAEPVLTRWCELAPGEALPVRLRMDLRHRLARGQWSHADRLRLVEGAFADGRRVLELDPGNDAVRREVAWLGLQTGRFPEAEADCRQCLARDPRDGWVHYLLAKSLHGQMKGRDAEAVLDPILAAQPKFADALLLRAILHREATQPDRAIERLRQALALDTGPRRECLYHLGLALAEAGKTDEAARAMAEVDLLSLNGAMTNDHFPDTAAMRVQIAEAMLGMGRAEEAKTQLDRVLAETPDFAPAHRVLAVYFERLGQSERASEHRRRADRKARP